MQITHYRDKFTTPFVKRGTAMEFVLSVLNPICWQTEADILRSVQLLRPTMALNNVNNTLNRMYRDGLIRREFRDRRWVYILRAAGHGSVPTS